jgi:hypothetical protein
MKSGIEILSADTSHVTEKLLRYTAHRSLHKHR